MMEMHLCATCGEFKQLCASDASCCRFAEHPAGFAAAFPLLVMLLSSRG